MSCALDRGRGVAVPPFYTKSEVRWNMQNLGAAGGAGSRRYARVGADEVSAREGQGYSAVIGIVSKMLMSSSSLFRSSSGTVKRQPVMFRCRRAVHERRGIKSCKVMQ